MLSEKALAIIGESEQREGEDDYDKVEHLAELVDHNIDTVKHEILGVLRALANGERGQAHKLLDEITDRIAIEESGELGDSYTPSREEFTSAWVTMGGS